MLAQSTIYCVYILTFLFIKMCDWSYYIYNFNTVINNNNNLLLKNTRFAHTANDLDFLKAERKMKIDKLF